VSGATVEPKVKAWTGAMVPIGRAEAKKRRVHVSARWSEITPGTRMRADPTFPAHAGSLPRRATRLGAKTSCRYKMLVRVQRLAHVIPAVWLDAGSKAPA